MKKLLYILLLFPLLLQGQSYELKPDVKPMFRTIYEQLTPITPADDSTVFYVDAISGDDSRRGWGNPDSAWQTIAKVNSETFDPEDSILFNKGDEWRETLTIPSSGTVGVPIVFSSYGTGNMPHLTRSDSGSVWDSHAGSIYKIGLFNDPTAGIGTRPGQPFVIENDGSTSWMRPEQDDIADLDTAGDWVWQNDSIYAFFAVTPNTSIAWLEVPQGQNVMELDSNEYITIENLNIQYAALSGIRGVFEQGPIKGLTVQDDSISYIGIQSGAAAYGTHAAYTDMIIQRNVIHDCGRRGISVNPTSSDYSFLNILIDGNEIYNCFHSGIDAILGGGDNASIDGYTVRNNFIWQDTLAALLDIDVMNHIFIADQNTDTGTFHNVLVYNNISENTSNKSIQVEKIQNAKIFNNTAWGVNPNVSAEYAFLYLNSADTNVVSMNNLYYGNSSTTRNQLTTTGTEVDTIDYNLYFQVTASDDIIRFNTGGSLYNMSEFAAYKAATTWDANSPTPADPLVFTDDFALRTGSPAIGAGQNLSTFFNTDINGNPRTEPWDIGASAIVRDGDTLIVFEISSSVNDSIDITTLGYPSGFESITINAKEGACPTTPAQGTVLVNGETDSTAVDGRYGVVGTADTTWCGTAWITASNVQSYTPNNDTTDVDTTGVVPSGLIANLVAYYKLDEAAGLTAIDELGNFNGTNSGATVNQPGKINTCYEFTSDSIVVDTVLTDETFSISAWVWTDVSAASRTIWGSRVNGGVQLRLSTTDALNLLKQSTTNMGTASSPIAEGEWEHIVVTYDGSTVRFYLNGGAVGTASSSVSFTRTVNYLGERGVSSEDWEGELDEIGIWMGRVLDSDDVTELYNLDNGLTYPFQ